MTDDIFTSKDEDKPNADDKPAAGTEGNLAVYLELLTKEDGTPKYATPEEALKASVHAQNHIATLEQELKALREKDDKDVGMEKILEALNGKPDGDPSKEQPKGLTKDDVAEVVTQLIETRETVTSEKQNVTTVKEKFKTLYGEKASEVMYGRAKDLGLERDDINKLIATKPIAAMKILGVDGEKPATTDGLATGSINTDGFQVKGDETPVSSMGFVSSKQLTENWEKNKAAVNKRLGVEILP